MKIYFIYNMKPAHNCSWPAFKRMKYVFKSKTNLSELLQLHHPVCWHVFLSKRTLTVANAQIGLLIREGDTLALLAFSEQK